MHGKPSKQQGLFDDGSLIGFLQSTLEAMETAAGGQLSEERAKLQQLQMALGGLGLTASKPVEADDLVLASQLDKLEQQLEAVEAQISSADDPTKQLLTKSTAVWAGMPQDGDTDGGAAAASSSAADGNGDSVSASADACGTGGNAGLPDRTSGAIESGLLPVPEQEGEAAES
ncbi:hypothetical protein PLESTB_000361200 [Pleodorina starrii]|uniref:Uncharacterized protein n=1 Tax=Pleodorina starrii TaxID=330485 RepID=A0A9W6BET0_9CHLO|nr:hypothetical protein PLESTM_000034000 [Pleodorina starrii]GLC50272.1 hypothetical protein PLESTB_000361200 [Pleodorina starrii]GLC64344.1 hypothetical protein PLESTF_000151400 [Pleodorina starrii]